MEVISPFSVSAVREKLPGGMCAKGPSGFCMREASAPSAKYRSPGPAVFTGSLREGIRAYGKLPFLLHFLGKQKVEKTK